MLVHGRWHQGAFFGRYKGKLALEIGAVGPVTRNKSLGLERVIEGARLDEAFFLQAEVEGVGQCLLQHRTSAVDMVEFEYTELEDLFVNGGFVVHVEFKLRNKGCYGQFCNGLVVRSPFNLGVLHHVRFCDGAFILGRF